MVTKCAMMSNAYEQQTITPIFLRISKIKTSINQTKTRALLYIFLTTIACISYSNNVFAGSLEDIANQVGNEAQQATATMIQDLCPQMAAIRDELNERQALLLGECAALVQTANGIVDPESSPPLDLGYTEEELMVSMSEVAHEEVAAQSTVATEVVDGQLSDVAGRMSGLRAGNAGPVAGLTLNMNGQNLPATLFSDLVGNLTRGGGASSDTAPSGKWGYFLTGLINFGDKDSTDREAGFDFDTKGITGGLDYRFSDSTIAGMAIGYTSTDTKTDNNAGNFDTETLSITVFGTHYRKDDFYVDGMFNYGNTDYDTERNIIFPQSATVTIADTITGDTDGTHYAVNVGVGKDFIKPTGLEFGVYGRANYYDGKIDSYQEKSTGSSALELDIRDQDFKSLASIIGGEISKTYSKNFGVVIPRARIEYIHEFEDDSRGMIARYVNDPFGNAFFQVPTDKPDRDYFFAGFGISSVFRNGTQAYLYYETTLGYDDITNNAFVFGLRSEI